MLLAAFGKASITPNEPTYLCGHAIRTEKSTGVLDDITCSVLMLDADGTRYLIASLELVGIDRELLDRMKQEAQSRGIAPERVLISVTHTHAAPEYQARSVLTDDPERGALPGYRDFLVERFAAAMDAAPAPVEVSLQYGSVTVDGFYGNRNDPSRAVEKRVHVVGFVDGAGHLLTALVNLTCHSTVLGPQNLLISGDLHGAVRRRLVEQWDADVVMINGAEGDVSNRHWREGEDAAELERVADGIAKQIGPVELSPLETSGVSLRDITYVFEYDVDLDRIHDEIKRAQGVLAHNPDPVAEKTTRSGLAFLERNVQVGGHVRLTLPTMLLRLGELVVVTVGAELFSALGLEISAAGAGVPVMVWGLTDGSIGYLVTREFYGRSYESMTTSIPAGEPENYAHAIARIVAEEVAPGQ